MKQNIERFLRLKPVSFVTDVLQLYFKKHISRSAAQLAYFLTLTFFPILICISAVLGQVNLRLDNLLSEAQPLLPAGVYSIFQEYLGYLDNNLSLAMFIAGIFMTVLFASAAIRGLRTIMHEIYGDPVLRGSRQFLSSFLFALMLLVTIYLSMAVVLTGNWFFHLLGDLLGLSDLADRIGAWQWIKYLLLLAIVFLFIFLLYRFTAPVRRPYPPVIPGALLASAALVIASLLFSVFVGHSTRYSLVYGSLASVIIMLVWLYLCGNILVLGNVVNYVIYTRRQNKPI